MDPNIDTRTSRMSVGTMAQFATPLPWARILFGSHKRLTDWWRDVIGQAEDDGFLRWEKKTRTWTLTEAGRAHVRAVA